MCLRQVYDRLNVGVKNLLLTWCQSLCHLVCKLHFLGDKELNLFDGFINNCYWYPGSDVCFCLFKFNLSPVLAVVVVEKKSQTICKVWVVKLCQGFSLCSLPLAWCSSLQNQINNQEEDKYRQRKSSQHQVSKDSIAPQPVFFTCVTSYITDMFPRSNDVGIIWIC